MPDLETPTETTSIINEDGSFAENWYEKYGEENKDHLSRFKKFDDFVNSSVSARKKIGRDPDTLIQIPDENSSDEVKAAWSKARGRPDTSDKYEYTMSDEHAVKVGPLDDKKMTAFREFAHKRDWSQSEFKEALDFYLNMVSGDIDTNNIAFNEKKAEVAEKGKAELKKKWLGEYDNRVLRANAVLRKYGGADAVASFGAENSPQMAVFLDNIAEAMSEDTLKGITSITTPTRDSIKTQIADVRAQMDIIVRENPHNFKANAKYKELKEKKTELYKQMSA